MPALHPLQHSPREFTQKASGAAPDGRNFLETPFDSQLLDWPTLAEAIALCLCHKIRTAAAAVVRHKHGMGQAWCLKFQSNVAQAVAVRAERPSNLQDMAVWLRRWVPVT